MWPFQKRTKKTTKHMVPLTIKELEDLPYSDDVDLPDEEKKLRALHRYVTAGAEASYDIRKVFNAKGMGARTVMKVHEFPTLEGLEGLVEDRFGGGTYRVHQGGSPRVFKTYHVDGPARFQIGEPKEPTLGQVLKEMMQEKAIDWFEVELDRGSEVATRLAWDYIYKPLGIELPPEPSWEEKRFQEALENNPEHFEQYFEARMAMLRGPKAEEPSTWAQLRTELEEYNELKQVLGRDTGAGGGFRETLRYLAPGIRELIRVMLPKTGKAGEGGPQPEPDQQAAANPAAAESASPGVPSRQDPTVSPPLPSPVAQETVPPVASVPKRPEPSPPEPPKAKPEAAKEPDRELDWVSLLSQLDWAEVERGVHGDPGEFIQRAYDSALDGQDGTHEALARLFHDLEPPAILDALTQAVESTAVAAGNGEEYEVAVLVVKHLTETEAGRAWLAKAHNAAGAIEVRRLQMEQGRAMIEGWKAHGGDPAFEETGQDANAEIDGPVLI